jgi:DNA-binding SARP family transcriptional activator
MLRLTTLGGLTLADAGGKAPVTQRLRLALLALLAVAGERALSRDKVVAALWPESPTEKARHALQQLLYSLRRQLPEEGILGTDPIRLSPGVFSCDLWEFERALAASSPEAALAAYRGPFLDGFFLPESVAFESWAEGERLRLAGDYQRLLARTAKAASQMGQHTLAIQYWRELATLDPLSERSAMGLIKALVSAGDVAEATRHARGFETLVRQELQSTPATDLPAYIEQIRRLPPGPPKDGPAVVPDTSEERFVIERELGRGSAATVYLARDRKLDRPVALKVLRPALAASVEGKRFLREIAIAARLHHPHILQLHDSGELPATDQGPRLYYVMPYVEGESLRGRLSRENRLSVAEALRLTGEVADALGYAHSRGIVHRDIKPANILLESGHALVADFGIAHALQVAGGERLSGFGVAMGTPSYMSPEQAIPGAPLDGRSDLYSLACMLYELLAGEPPFGGRTAQAILARHASDPVPPLATLCPEVPAAIEQAIRRALAKTPNDRFETMDAFANALGLGPA